MLLFFHRPKRLSLASECHKVVQTKRRRPLDKSGNIKFVEAKEKEEKETSKDVKVELGEDDKLNGNGEKENSSPDSKESDIKGVEGKGKLDKILKKLAERMTSTLTLNGSNGNGTNGHHAPHPPTSYSLANHIANTINTQPHQHVSPRKRILRELEKVSLEDTKRSRPKTQNGNTIPPSSISPQTTNGSLKNQSDKAPTAPPVSRPYSSYSITSLLAHNNTSNASSGSGCNSINDHTNDSSSTSHYHHRDGAPQRLSLSQQHSPPKSPSMMQPKRKSPNTTPPGSNNHYHSPNQSPSPEHHAFHKYRPTTTPTATQQSSPYSGSYHSPNYMRGSPSPHGEGFNNNRLRTTGNYQHSPSHYASSPSQNYPTPRDSSLSPNVERSQSSRSTPTSSGTTGIRTVPKKTAALRQQFSSPTMESKKSTIKSEKPMDVDALLRPSAIVPPPLPHPSQMYPYMFPTMNYLPPGVPPYYHPAFYNPAMMAAAAASYRIPGMPMPGYPGASLSPVSAAQLAATSPPVANTNGQRNSTLSSPPATHASISPYVPTSPWNPIPLTNHSINDGNLIAKAKDEPSSGEFNSLLGRL
jgi:hairless